MGRLRTQVYFDMLKKAPVAIMDASLGNHQDIILQERGYAVVKGGEFCAARLRVSEKHFVADHAQLLGVDLFSKSS